MEREAQSASFVVVGFDGSSSSFDAVAIGARAAQLRHLPLRVAHAFIWPLLDASETDDLGLPGLRAKATAQLAAATEAARSVAPTAEIDSQLVPGWPVPVLTDASRGAALTVIGSHGFGRVVTGLVGSTAIDLAALGHSPLVVARSADTSSPGHAADAPIVVGVDGSASSIVAAWFAAAEAELVRAPLHVAQIRPSPDDEVAARSLVDTLRGARPHLEIELRALDGHADDELVGATEYARMVVVGTRGRSGFAGLLLGSVSHALFERANCPVAVMPRRFVRAVVDRPGWSVSPHLPGSVA